MVQYVNINHYYYIMKIMSGTICEYEPSLLPNTNNLEFNFWI
jgi:hypothetical protein